VSSTRTWQSSIEFSRSININFCAFTTSLQNHSLHPLTTAHVRPNRRWPTTASLHKQHSGLLAHVQALCETHLVQVCQHGLGDSVASALPQLFFLHRLDTDAGHGHAHDVHVALVAQVQGHTGDCTGHGEPEQSGEGLAGGHSVHVHMGHSPGAALIHNPHTININFAHFTLFLFRLLTTTSTSNAMTVHRCTRDSSVSCICSF
jgi:hypothetical protein